MVQNKNACRVIAGLAERLCTLLVIRTTALRVRHPAPCAVEKLATHEANNLENVGANPTCATMRIRLEAKVRRPITSRRKTRWAHFPHPLPVLCVFSKHIGGGNGCKRSSLVNTERHVNCKHYSFGIPIQAIGSKRFLGSSNYKRISKACLVIRSVAEPGQRASLGTRRL